MKRFAVLSISYLDLGVLVLSAWEVIDCIFLPVFFRNKRSAVYFAFLSMDGYE
jgi:hypothetical protein